MEERGVKSVERVFECANPAQLGFTSRLDGKTGEYLVKWDGRDKSEWVAVDKVGKAHRI